MTVLCPRSTSSTCAPRTPRVPASSGWCGKAMNPGPSPAASMPGVSSASRLPKGWGHPVLWPWPPRHGWTPRHPALPHMPSPSQAQLGAASPPNWGQRGALGLTLLSPTSPGMGPNSAPSPPCGGGGIWGSVGACYTLLGDAAAPNQCRAPPATGEQECFPVWVGGCFARECWAGVVGRGGGTRGSQPWALHPAPLSGGIPAPPAGASPLVSYQ